MHSRSERVTQLYYEGGSAGPGVSDNAAVPARGEGGVGAWLCTDARSSIQYKESSVGELLAPRNMADLRGEGICIRRHGRCIPRWRFFVYQITDTTCSIHGSEGRTIAVSLPGIRSRRMVDGRGER